MNRSYWDESLLPKKFNTIVIGSGIVGLSAALHIKQKNPDREIAVLERGIIPGGASMKNAGFACFGSLSEIVDDLKLMGEDEVVPLIRSRWEGLNYLLELTRNYDIGYQNLGGYELFTRDLMPLYEECASQIESINAMLQKNFGQPVFSASEDQIDSFGFEGVQHMIYNPFEGQLHPGKLIRALIDRCRKSGVHLYYGAEVNSWNESANEIVVNLNNTASIRTSKLIVATNGFASDLIPDLEVKAARAQVLITEPVSSLKFAGTFHMDRGYYYFRNIDNRVLLGGARNTDTAREYTTSNATTSQIQEVLEATLHRVILPGSKTEPELRWSGTMGIGPSKAPIIKKVSDRIAVAVRLGGMGIALGSHVGQQVATLMQD